MTDGADFSGAVVGAAQTISNLEAPADIRLANAWMSWDAGGKGGVKLGVVDLNTEFDVQSTAALFLNSAFGIGPDFSQSGQNGPSIFPSTGLGLVGWWLPGGHWQLKAGLFEGASGDPTHPGRTNFILSRDEGALIVLEARNHLTENFVIGAGTWRYTADLPGARSHARQPFRQCRLLCHRRWQALCGAGGRRCRPVRLGPSRMGGCAHQSDRDHDQHRAGLCRAVRTQGRPGRPLRQPGAIRRRGPQPVGPGRGGNRAGGDLQRQCQQPPDRSAGCPICHRARRRCGGTCFDHRQPPHRGMVRRARPAVPAKICAKQFKGAKLRQACICWVNGVFTILFPA